MSKAKVLKKLLVEDFAGEILKQLGGNKFIAMTGAKNLAKDAKTQTIHMKIGKNAKSISHVRIKLNGKDLYDMEFLRARGANIKVVSQANDIYNDQLQSVFTEHTGLDTHL